MLDQPFSSAEDLHGSVQLPAILCLLLEIRMISPQHYEQFEIEPVEFITQNRLNYLQGNIIKYILRYKQKNGIEDLEKAKTYLEYLINFEKEGRCLKTGKNSFKKKKPTKR